VTEPAWSATAGRPRISTRLVAFEGFEYPVLYQLAGQVVYARRHGCMPLPARSRLAV
jgi:hypothetical protein